MTETVDHDGVSVNTILTRIVITGSIRPCMLCRLEIHLKIDCLTGQSSSTDTLPHVI